MKNTPGNRMKPICTEVGGSAVTEYLDCGEVKMLEAKATTVAIIGASSAINCMAIYELALRVHQDERPYADIFSANGPIVVVHNMGPGEDHAIRRALTQARLDMHPAYLSCGGNDPIGILDVVLSCDVAVVLPDVGNTTKLEWLLRQDNGKKSFFLHMGLDHSGQAPDYWVRPKLGLTDCDDAAAHMQDGTTLEQMFYTKPNHIVRRYGEMQALARYYVDSARRLGGPRYWRQLALISSARDEWLVPYERYGGETQ